MVASSFALPAPIDVQLGFPRVDGECESSISSHIWIKGCKIWCSCSWNHICDIDITVVYDSYTQSSSLWYLIIMLCMITHIVIMSRSVASSQNYDAPWTMEKQTYNTPNAHSTSFLCDSWVLVNFRSSTFVGTIYFFHKCQPRRISHLESSLVGFGVLHDNTIKGLTRVLIVEQVLSEKSKRFNT
jgi:hypothetical protein